MSRAFATLSTASPVAPAATGSSAWRQVLVLGAIFGAAYSQFPLYFLVQNQYFFYALVRNEVGLLRFDWLARTFDPWPAFTQVASLTFRFLDERLFYVYFVLLLGIYAYSLVGIADALFGIRKSPHRYLSFLALLVLIHSPLFGWVAETASGLDLRITLIEGVASQRILWEMFQPGAFGVLLLLSIYLFLRGRPFWAAVSSSLAVTFNPVYVFGASILTAAYVLAMLQRREGIWRALAVGLCALVVVLPTVVVVSPIVLATTPAIRAQAAEILVHLRLSVHAQAATWFNEAVYIKLAVVLAALFVIRRTALFGIMAFSTAAVLGVTLLQVVSGNETLALLYPWRLSVVLVPLSTAILLAFAVTRVLDWADPRLGRGRGVLVLTSMALIGALMVGGAAVTARRFAAGPSPEVGPIARFVAQTKTAGDTYLIPLVLERDDDPTGYSGDRRTPWYGFRVSSGAPTFADWGFIPYRDTEVLQWFERVKAADGFFTANRDRRCGMAAVLRVRYGVTHAILKSSDPEVCPSWKLLLKAPSYSLFALAP